MLDFEAIDAKIRRARNELRLLKADIDAFCEERARLIVPEGLGDEVVWVYRGDTPTPPVDWSIRVGEFAYNLRSSLDHLVWQLVIDNNETPGTGNAFPIFKHPANDQDIDMGGRLKGLRNYLKRQMN